MAAKIDTRTKVTAHVHFPTYPDNRQPLRTQFDADVRRPSICKVYRKARNNRLVLVNALLPARAVK